MAPKAGLGIPDSRGNERGFDQSFATVVQGEIPKVLFIYYLGKKGHINTTAPQPQGIVATWTLVQQIPAKSPTLRGLLVGKTPAVSPKTCCFSFHDPFCLNNI